MTGDTGEDDENAGEDHRDRPPESNVDPDQPPESNVDPDQPPESNVDPDQPPESKSDSESDPEPNGEGEADAGDSDAAEEEAVAGEVAALRADLERVRSDVDALADRSVTEDDVSGVRDAVRSVRDDLDALEERIDERTVDRDDFEAELRRYVRKRVRRGHATGWGPYLVLLYGTAMTVAAYYYLGDRWAILAMFVVWLSTLGLYVFMLVVGVAIGAGKRVGGLLDVVGKRR